VYGPTRRFSPILASAFASSAALLGACLEQGRLFADYMVASPEVPAAGNATTPGVADGGAAEIIDALVPAAPEVPREAPPLDVELSGVEGDAGASRPADAPAANDCEASDAGATLASCAPPGPNDACSACLSSECPDAIATCRATSGCDAIVACARSTGCIDDECYCGSFNVIACAAPGGGNGPCRDVTLAAPGSHEPTPAIPNAGPAAEAARVVGTCRRSSGGCDEACGG
jgi:hypothetical protein